MRGSIMVHAADQGHTMNLLGEKGQVLADVVARDGSGNGSKGALDVTARIWFEIKSVNMAEATPGKNDDAAAGPAEATCFLWCEGTGLPRERKISWQTHPQGSGAKKIPTIQVGWSVWPALIH